MPYDATKMADWQISEAAEENMKTIWQLRDEMELQGDEVIPYGKMGRLNYAAIMARLDNRPNGKYIDVTAITPTPLGEGKTTTTIGLLEGLGKRGQIVGGAIRQPSTGPTMNVKGSAGGGGNAQVVPLTEFSLGLTGDIDRIMNAHNIAMVALTARMQHERNYGDKELKKGASSVSMSIQQIYRWAGLSIFVPRRCAISLSGWAAGWTGLQCSRISILGSVPNSWQSFQLCVT